MARIVRRRKRWRKSCRAGDFMTAINRVMHLSGAKNARFRQYLARLPEPVLLARLLVLEAERLKPEPAGHFKRLVFRVKRLDG